MIKKTIKKKAARKKVVKKKSPAKKKVTFPNPVTVYTSPSDYGQLQTEYYLD